MASAFQLEELDRQVALVTFDLPGKKVNTLGRAVLKELTELLGRLEKRDDLRGLLFRGKPGQFIAGADLNELGALAFVPREQVAKGVEFGHMILGRIGRLPFPTVALIDGPCMGGGHRAGPGDGRADRLDESADEDRAARGQGRPASGLGGDAAAASADRRPSGRRDDHLGRAGGGREGGRAGAGLRRRPRRAAGGGRAAGWSIICEESGVWKEDRKTRSAPVGLTEDQARFLFAAAEGFILGKTKGQYPAPLAALKAIREGCNLPLEEGLKAEQAAAMEVVGTPISANLIGVFFMNNRLARDPGVVRPGDRTAAGAQGRRAGRGLDGRGHRHGACARGRSGGDGRHRRQPASPTA